jgi:translation elongation factor EF-1alpha
MGRNSFKYAWIFDQVKKKHELGVAIDISSCQFEINKSYITLMDGPGMRNFIKTMITSISIVRYFFLRMVRNRLILSFRLIVLYY